jgi:protein TonB
VIDHGPVIFAEYMPVFGKECFDLDRSERKTCSDRALLSFVQSRVGYPALARENGIQGTVVVSFTVEKDGSISDVVAAREVAGGCTAAALKAVNAINKEKARFKPGIQGGLPVRVRFNLPVKFSLQ